MTRKQFKAELARLAREFVPPGVNEREHARRNPTYRAILRGTRLLFAESELSRRSRRKAGAMKEKREILLHGAEREQKDFPAPGPSGWQEP